MMRILTARMRAEKGQSSVELAAFVPILLVVLLLVIQGIAAMSAGSDIRDAARDGARALERGESPSQAVHQSMPEWIDLKAISSCGQGCIRVTGEVPLGVPGYVEVTHVPISAEATFRMREGLSWP